MTQIMFLATTAATVAYGATLTTGNVQLLPSWAPPIDYIGSTTPWLAVFLGVTTLTGDIEGAGRYNRTQKVRAYGRKTELHSGAEVVALQDKVELPAGEKRMILLTYRAVGETVRP